MDSRELIKEARASVRQKFEEWQKRRHRFGPAHTYTKDQFVQAWANVAYVADLEREATLNHLSKLQQRICRQRKANREQKERIETLEQRIEELERG